MATIRSLLRFTLTGGPQLAATLRAKGPRIHAVLSSKLMVLMTQLASYIVSQKLSGQILKRQTGVLSGSVRALPVRTEGPYIIGGVEAGSGPAFYASFHEYGVNKSWAIVATKARALRFLVDGKVVFAKSVVHPPLAARPFMAPSLEENRVDILEQMQAALDEEMQQS